MRSPDDIAEEPVPEGAVFFTLFLGVAQKVALFFAKVALSKSTG